MPRFPVYPRVLLVLAGFATVTPIFGGYLMGLLLLVWVVWRWARARSI